MRWLCLHMLLLPLTLSAQVGDSVAVTFIIQDSITREPVPFATITVDGKLFGQSDFDGVARFMLPKGEHKYEVSYIGYKTVCDSVKLNSKLDVLVQFVSAVKTSDTVVIVVSTGGPRMTREMLICGDTLSISAKTILKLDYPSK